MSTCVIQQSDNLRMLWNYTAIQQLQWRSDAVCQILYFDSEPHTSLARTDASFLSECLFHLCQEWQGPNFADLQHSTQAAGQDNRSRSRRLRVKMVKEVCWAPVLAEKQFLPVILYSLQVYPPWLEGSWSATSRFVGFEFPTLPRQQVMLQELENIES